LVLKETMEKEDNIVRYESLSLPMSNEGGTGTEITFESEDPETMIITVDNKFIGLMDMANFLAFCKRALELWEKEV
jgi:hypothetical protein